MATAEYNIKLRSDTAANFTSANPILLVGEVGFETDTRKAKIGDGSTAWNSLTYDLLTRALIGVANGLTPLNASGKVDAGYIDQVAVASSTAFTPSGNIAATNVQTAIQELDTEKAIKDNGTLTNSTLTTAKKVHFDTTAGAPAYTEATMYWDANAHTLALQTGLGNTTLAVGQESYTLCVNNTGSTILNGKVVYISGASLGIPTIALAKADSTITSDSVLGVTTQDIANGAHGFVTTFGVVHDVNTSAYLPGTTLYLSATNAGEVTDVAPLSPNYVVHIGHVFEQNAVTGSIYVSINTITQTANSVRLTSGIGVAELNNVQDFFRHSWSTGLTDGSNITDNGNGTVNITAGEIVIRETSVDDAEMKAVVVPAVTNLAIPANDVSYLYVNYNGGNPIWQTGSTLADFDGMSKVIVYIIGRNGLILNIVDLRKINVDSQRKARRQKAESDGVVLNGWWRSSLSKSLLSASGLNVLVGTGKYFYFDNPITHSAFDTSVAGTANANVFKYFYNRTGTWTQIVDQKTINNTQYDLNGTLTAITSNRYRTDWVYVVMCNANPYLAIVMGNDQYTSLALAQAAPQPTTLPPQFDGIGLLVGQICVLQGAATFSVQRLGQSSYTLVPV